MVAPVITNSLFGISGSGGDSNSNQTSNESKRLSVNAK
jgi:hypothetical protein